MQKINFQPNQRGIKVQTTTNLCPLNKNMKKVCLGSIKRTVKPRNFKKLFRKQVNLLEKVKGLIITIIVLKLID